MRPIPKRLLIIAALGLCTAACGPSGGGGGGEGGGGGSTEGGGVEVAWTPNTTVSVSGTVVTPDGSDPSAMELVAPGMNGGPPIAAGGGFSIDDVPVGTRLIAAVPPDREFALMNLVSVPEGGTGPTDLAVNVQTTAVALVLINPLFFESDPERFAVLRQRVEQNAKVQSLATVLETLYTKPKPAEEPLFVNALQSALASVAEEMVADVQDQVNGALTVTGPRGALSQSDPTYFYVDQEWVELRPAVPQGNQWSVEVALMDAAGSDRLVELYEVAASEFPDGLESLTASKGRDLTLGQRFGDVALTAKSAFRYISAAYWLAETVKAAAKLAGAKPPKPRFLVPDKAAVYLMRAYSSGHVDVQEYEYAVTAGAKHHMTGRIQAQNAVMILVDALSAFPPADVVLSDDSLRQEFTNALAKPLIEGFAAMGPPTSEKILALAYATAEGVLIWLINQGIKLENGALAAKAPQWFSATSRFGAFMTSALKAGSEAIGTVAKIIKFMDPTSKAAAVGKLVNRVAAVAFSTALETAFVVVGAPFGDVVGGQKCTAADTATLKAPESSHLEDAAGCIEDCVLDEPEAACQSSGVDCLYDADPNLSKGCRACVVAFTYCTAAVALREGGACISACAELDEGCLACLKQQCVPAFTTCSGVTPTLGGG